MTDSILKALARGEVPVALVEEELKGTADMSETRGMEVDAVRHAFRNADAKDWEHLERMLSYSGHGQFWRAVFAEVKTALAADYQEECCE